VLSLYLIIACLAPVAAIAFLDWFAHATRKPSANSQDPIRAADSQGPITGTDFHGRPMPIGTPAPDFTLPRLDKGPPVCLADLLRERPVVLIFGSFGCSYFCHQLGQVRQLQDRYEDRADFLFVYINNRHQEPNSLQGAVPDRNAPADAPVNRLARIREGMQHFGVSMTCVVDTGDDRVQLAYDAFPARLVIADQAGKVAFDSGTILNSGLDLAGAAAWLEEHTGPTRLP
jgi:hypothetical protein